MDTYNVKRASIALMNLPGVGKMTAGKLFSEAADLSVEGVDALFEFLQSQVGRWSKFKGLEIHDVSAAYEKADRDLDRCDDLGISVLCRGNELVPKFFWGISNPPFLLYARGDLTSLNGRIWMAIIGSREATEYGLKSGYKFGVRCAEAGMGVVSGLANGCDTSGHRGCLDAGGITVAFMAHGLDSVHPSSNRELASNIVDEGGALISEYGPGVEPRPNQYIERDRLQSALSHGVIVVETALDGGTMHAVRSAKKQGRLLACLEHPESSPHGDSISGNHVLVKDPEVTSLLEGNDLEAFINDVKYSTPGNPEQQAFF